MDPSVERKWQDKWLEAGIFQPKPDSAKKKFFITVPWPYTNSSLHVGHGRTYTTADIIARYKRLSGYNVLFPMAFHQSGTPILAISERISRGDEKTLQQYRDTLREYEKEEDIGKRIEEFKEPQNIATYFSERIVKDFTSLGYSIDWRSRFTSGDPFYQEFVKWQFRKLNSLGLIKNGEYPVLYSINDRNAVGEDDISDGDIDKVTIEEFTGVIFKGKDFSLIAASLRPETVYGITNLWIAPGCTYIKFRMKGQNYVVSEDALEKMQYQHQGLEKVGPVKEEEILSSEFETPLEHRKINAYLSSFVDPDNGTGIVYSVPGHAVWDYIAIKDAQLNLAPIKVLELTGADKSTVESLVEELKISSLKDSGKIKEATQRLYKLEFYDGKMLGNNGRFSGLGSVKARDEIKNELFSSEEGFIFYETSRKAQTRSGSKVIVAVLSNQWFIDYSVEWWKKASHEVVNSMMFYPEFYRNAMNDAVDWLRERPCARRRGIGTKLPFDDEWVIESLSDSTLYPIIYTNQKNISEIFSILGKIPDEIIEYVYNEGKEEPISLYSEKVVELARKAREAKDYWYGVDVRLTAAPHLSNHLAFYIMNHAAILPKRDNPKGIIISGLLLANGAKISKSKGNAIPLLKISTRYTADLYRLFVAVSADISSVLDWNETEIAAVRKKYESFVEYFSNNEGKEVPANKQVEDWFLAKFNLHMKEYFMKMDAYDIRGAYISVFYEVLNDLKYVENRGGSVQACLYSIGEIWLKVMTPVIPHTCEEIWSSMGHNDFISSQELHISQVGKTDESIILSENYVQETVADLRAIMKATGISPKTIEIEVCGSEVRDAAAAMLDNRLKDLPSTLKPLIPEFMKIRKGVKMDVGDELGILSRNREYIESLFGCKVNITQAEIYPGRKNAWPGRPLIRLK